MSLPCRIQRSSRRAFEVERQEALEHLGVGQLDELAGGLSYTLALLVGWIRKREGFKRGRRRVSEAGLDLSHLRTGAADRELVWARVLSG